MNHMRLYYTYWYIWPIFSVSYKMILTNLTFWVISHPNVDGFGFNIGHFVAYRKGSQGSSAKSSRARARARSRSSRAWARLVPTLPHIRLM